MNDTREYIIDQSYNLFLCRSYEAVSINDISKAVELTKGALYHHFRNKEEIFKAVIDKYLLITETNFPALEISFKELIEESIKKTKEIVYNILGEKPAFIPVNYMALFIDAFRHYQGFANEKGNWFLVEIEKIKTVMDNAIKRGEIRKDIDTKIMATNYFSITIGIAVNFLHNSSPKMIIKELREQLNEFYNILKI